jgi:hypothetical protein
MYKNVVEYRVVCLFVGTKRPRRTVEDLRNYVTVVPDSGKPSGGTQPTYFDRGSAGLLLLAASYWDNTAADGGLSIQRHSAPVNFETRPGTDRIEMNDLNKKLPGEAGKKKEP